jgi:hypothetical protein
MDKPRGLTLELEAPDWIFAIALNEFLVRWPGGFRIGAIVYGFFSQS